MISEKLFGRIHYASGDAVKYELHNGSVKHHIDVRVQGQDRLVYFRVGDGDGWLPLSADMAREFAKSLREAADATARIEDA
jgi:hypothetical protein